jgi:hypothetical protein
VKHPGDPVRASLGLTAPPELVDARRALLGLDRPLIIQYGDYLAALARGDLGTSFMSQLPVTEIIAQRLGNTLLLAGLAMLLVALIGMSAGLGIAVASWNGRQRGASIKSGCRSDLSCVHRWRAARAIVRFAKRNASRTCVSRSAAMPARMRSRARRARAWSSRATSPREPGRSVGCRPIQLV